MAILKNKPCPACRATGHDKTGDHLMVFEDGGVFCNRKHFHKNGQNYYAKETDSGIEEVVDQEITGKIKYTKEEFKALLARGKLSNPHLRLIALSGMKMSNAWEFYTEEEKADFKLIWSKQLSFFHELPIKGLSTRGIGLATARLYGVKVGLDFAGKVNRHYYPIFGYPEMEDGKPKGKPSLIGAKVRELPKTFIPPLGQFFLKNNQLFGQSTLPAVIASGQSMRKLVLSGGECDAMSVLTMLVKSQIGTKHEGKLHHSWSPMRGEHIDEIIFNKKAISAFDEILVAADDDEQGNKFALAVKSLFPDKAKRILMPSGCKDPNQCLLEGRVEEFINNYWNPVEIKPTSRLISVKDVLSEVKKTPKMGLSWFAPSLNQHTFGIRPYTLYTWVAGTGVGKTTLMKEVAFHVSEVYNQTVGVLFLEEQYWKTIRNFAGFYCNKSLQEPPINDPEQAGYLPENDYTEEEANEAIGKLAASDEIIVADTAGHKDIDTILELLAEMVEKGIRHIILDNLTAITLRKNAGTKVDAIDEAMKQLGTFKDEKPITLHLLAHLSKVQGDRIPYEEGGEIRLNDIRGAGSVAFWSNAVIGIERNTKAVTDEEKRLMFLRFLKNRDRGVSNNAIVPLRMCNQTGRLIDIEQEKNEFFGVDEANGDDKIVTIHLDKSGKTTNISNENENGVEY